MVLQDTRTVSPAHMQHGHVLMNGVKLDINRILGVSGTLLLNVLLLMLLLVPMRMPAPLPLEDKAPDLRWIDPTPATPPPPPVVQIVPPRAQPTPQPRIATPQPAVVDVPVVSDVGTPFVEQASVEGPVIDTAPTIAPPGPVTGMSLEYVHASSPRYPRDAIRGGLEGTVMLQVLVGVDGKPIEVALHRSSGHRVLDQEAVRHVLRQWTFRPAMRDGVPVQAIGIVPIDFRLDRG